MAKRCFSAGHGLNSTTVGVWDSGADSRWISDEATHMRKFMRNLAVDFAALGEPTAFRDSGLFSKADDEAAEWGAVEFYEGHMNAGGGKGTEVFVDRDHTESELAHAKRLALAISTAGDFYNRGAKVANFAVLRNHRGMASWLIEFCFVDNQADIMKWSKYNRKIELATVNAIRRRAGQKPVRTLPRSTVAGKLRWRRYFKEI